MESQYIYLEWLQESACFNILSMDENDLILVGNPLSLVYFRNGKKLIASLGRDPEKVETRTGSIEALGETRELVLEGEIDKGAIHYRLVLALLAQAPFVLWKISLENISCQGLQIDSFEMMRIDNNKAGRLDFSNPGFDDPAFFTNGWQSWSLSGAFGKDQKQTVSRLGFLSEPMAYNTGTPIPTKRGHFSSDFWAVLGDRKKQRGLLVGFLSQKEQFGSIEAFLGREVRLNAWANADRVWLPPGKSLETDWCLATMVDLSEPDPTGPYLDLVARFHRVKIPPTVASGWCSWYEYETKINPQIIRHQLERLTALKQYLPLDVFQIDDGFEAGIGDWLKNKPEFSEGLDGLAGEIKVKGFQPGIWLAPFIVHPGSDLYKNHPDWILRDRLGRRANAGFGWGSLTTALDLTHPQVLDYVGQVIRIAVNEWSFPYLKLDFLYAGALPGEHHDPTLTRAQVLRRGMETISQAAGPDTFLLGCGAPLGSALGLVDAMRIGPDVSQTWEPRFAGIKPFFKKEPFMPSVRNAIQNILTRTPYHNCWWVNDPDCLLVRENTQLSLDEVRSLATLIGLSGGMMLISDDLDAVSPERLRLVKVLLPLMAGRPDVLDWFDQITPQKVRKDLHGVNGEWSLLAWFNWSEKEVEKCLDFADFKIDPGEYWVRSFWDGRLIKANLKDGLYRGKVTPHGCVLLAVRIADTRMGMYLGSNLHISQGLELEDWSCSKQKMDFRLKTRMDGLVDIYVPWRPYEVSVDGFGPAAWLETAENICRITIRPDYFGRRITVQ